MKVWIAKITDEFDESETTTLVFHVPNSLKDLYPRLRQYLTTLLTKDTVIVTDVLFTPLYDGLNTLTVDVECIDSDEEEMESQERSFLFEFKETVVL